MWLYNGNCFQAAVDMLDHSYGKHWDYEEAMVQAIPE